MAFRQLLSIAALSVGTLVVAAAVPVPVQAQDGHAQSRVVDAVPASFTPNINDGQTYAINQVGGRIVVGGDFTNESNHASTAAMHQPNVFAFSATSGTLDRSFLPVLNGAVNSIEPGPKPNTV